MEERRYFANRNNLKAQIAKLEDGRFCLTRYSYPDKISHNEAFGQEITDTFEEAKAIIDRIYTDGMEMKEVTKAAFLSTFDDDNSEFNFNHYGLSLRNCRFGSTFDVVVRIGRKRYYMDIVRDAKSACIMLYDYVSKDRSSFSKYDKQANMHSMLVKSDAYIRRDLLERIAEIEEAQRLTQMYFSVLA